MELSIMSKEDTIEISQVVFVTFYFELMYAHRIGFSEQDERKCPYPTLARHLWYILCLKEHGSAEMYSSTCLDWVHDIQRSALHSHQGYWRAQQD